MSAAPLPNQPPAYPPPLAYPPRRGMNPWLIRIPVLFVSGGILLIVVLTLFLMAFQMRHADRIFPGVSAMGIKLDGLTLEQAKSTLENAFHYDETAVFTFRDGDRFWQLSAGELGVAFDVDATAEAAFAVGHENGFLGNLLSQADSWLSGYAVAPIVNYDQSVAVQRLSEIAGSINRQPVNASLSLTGTALSQTAGQNGRTLDLTTTLARLDSSILNMENGAEMPLVINETPPLLWSAEPAASQIQNALSGPLTLVAVDQNGQQLGPWTATADQIASLLTVSLVDNGDGTQSYDASIDMGAFENYLNTLAPGLLTTPVNGRFHFDDSTGQLVMIQPSVSGRSLNVAETLKRMEEAIFTPNNRIVPMAFDFVPARYHNQITAQELGITEMITEATTRFTGSIANRRTNIAVSASKFDGVIIAPGEEFSFNTLLGDLSYENGFVDAKVIVAEATTDGIGGGVCQVSTTIFRAAYSAGFPITELHSHSYRVGYYELNAQPGFDASIWTPDADFRFVNNTDYHILLETSVFPATDEIQFRLYSTKAWTVEVEDPLIQNRAPALPARYIANSAVPLGQSLQVDYSAEGADVTIARRIYDLQGNLVTRETIFRSYQPWQAVFEVAPTDSRLNSGGG